jgi:hypothetical protein
MGLFGSKDWNVVAIIFERPDMYRVNGNRGKGGEATTIRENVKKHPRTIFWGVFDQKGAFLEGAPAAGAHSIPPTTLQQLVREMAKLTTVREVLAALEKGTEKSLSKTLVWNGYPAKASSP